MGRSTATKEKEEAAVPAAVKTKAVPKKPASLKTDSSDSVLSESMRAAVGEMIEEAVDNVLDKIEDQITSWVHDNFDNLLATRDVSFDGHDHNSSEYWFKAAFDTCYVKKSSSSPIVVTRLAQLEKFTAHIQNVLLAASSAGVFVPMSETKEPIVEQQAEGVEDFDEDDPHISDHCGDENCDECNG